MHHPLSHGGKRHRGGHDLRGIAGAPGTNRGEAGEEPEQGQPTVGTIAAVEAKYNIRYIQSLSARRLS